MKKYQFILLHADGDEIDRTIVSAHSRKEAINHIKPYLKNGRKYSLKLVK